MGITGHDKFMERMNNTSQIKLYPWQRRLLANIDNMKDNPTPIIPMPIVRTCNISDIVGKSATMIIIDDYISEEFPCNQCNDGDVMHMDEKSSGVFSCNHYKSHEKCRYKK